MASWSVLLEIADIVGDLFKFVAPLWIAVVVGILIGWAWKPQWAYLGRHPLLNSSPFKHSQKAVESPTSSSSSSSSTPRPTLNFLKLQLPSCIPWISDDLPQKGSFSEPHHPTTSVVEADCSPSQPEIGKSKLVADDDLQYLYKLVHEKDGGPPWIQMMDRSTPTMSYQAWRRDRENGPPQYRSRTLFEDATPELVRDFFWDDEFRMKWDDMLIHAATLEECPITGTMVVQWVRKFPFFCSDREYIIGRRIWESGRMYYCVTKGVPCLSVPRRDKPKRVDLYYSSWCIRAVESKRGDGQLTACEVLLFHYEDMGIPWEIAKLGVRQGMWGAVKKIEPGLRAYQKQRVSGAALSRCAFMAQINAKVNADYLRSLASLEYKSVDSREVETRDSSEKPRGRNIPKLLIVGGAIALACTLDRGLLTKAVIFGVARRFGNIGRRL